MQIGASYACVDSEASASPLGDVLEAVVFSREFEVNALGVRGQESGTQMRKLGHRNLAPLSFQAAQSGPTCGSRVRCGQLREESSENSPYLQGGFEKQKSKTII